MSVPAELRQVIRRIEERTRMGAVRPVRRGTLEELVEGAAEETERGSIFVTRRRYPLDGAHGAQPLGPIGALDGESLAMLARREAWPGGARLLYLDTETTGLAGGTGTYAFLVGVGFVDGDAFEVRQYFMRDLDEEPALLAALDGIVRGFEGLVTYNGTGFDLPLLETRFVLGRRRWPSDPFHLDLLPAARRLWSGRLPDCRLGTVEQSVLRFHRRDDLPGALIPAVYFDYLRRKQPGELPRVFEHNRHDILSLAALTGWVTHAAARAPGADVAPDELAGLGHLWERRDADRGEACFREALARGIEGAGRARLLGRLAWGEKRRARWAEARALWDELAREQLSFDPRPWEEMAKIDEHRLRDWARARTVVQEALARAEGGRAAADAREALGHRLERLERRLLRSGTPALDA
jgi:uncharacterized protein